MSKQLAEESHAPKGRATPLITRQVIEEHRAALLAHARRLVRRPEDAEDAVQEAWIGALHSAASFEGRASLRTWRTSILRRRVVDGYRKQRLYVPLTSELPGPADPERRDLEEAAARAKTALAQLQELERRAIMLCDIDDCDRAEAAAHLRITRGHLRVLLHRARAKLERQLQAEGFGAEVLC
jgi:RNA polymerase sigma-70 factor (ECF subfamily)